MVQIHPGALLWDTKKDTLNGVPVFKTAVQPTPHGDQDRAAWLKRGQEEARNAAPAQGWGPEANQAAHHLCPTTRGKWVAVDLHGTLCRHDKALAELDPLHVGVPIPAMVERVRSWLEAGIEVRIFTAKIFPLWKVEPDEHMTSYVAAGHGQGERLLNEALPFARAIQEWCHTNLGEVLTLTCVKDRDCREIWDDKAVPVEKDTGRVLYDGEREFT